MDINSTRKLNNGVEIPRFGLGVFRSADGDETANAVRWAVEAGYRHIDTAMIYGNEKSVGEAIRSCGVPREKLFITTKLWNEDMRQHRQLEAFDESLKRMGLDYIDLYLIHWPVVTYLESWQAMEKIYATGRAKAVGVSNFQIHHMEAVLKQASLVPAVNQIEIHPYLTQKPLREYCEGKGVAVEAWSPLGGQGSEVIGNPVLQEIAGKHGKTAAQVILRWHLQSGIIVFPKSVKKARIVENSQIFDFELSAADMEAISALNRDQRYGSDPDNFNF
jgi:diketogulonate reductase-like aldo/keto reductase